MNLYIIFALTIIGGYILGSIPFGLVLTRLAGLGDIRKIGSGNIGATNVLRTGRKDLAILTILLDASKAGIAAVIAYHLCPKTDFIFFSTFTTLNIVVSLTAGFAAIIGHNFPVWLKFKGGKGVASSFGFIVATNPMIGLMAAITWLTTAFASKYSSLSALIAAVTLPIYTFFFADEIYMYFYTAIALLLIIRHHTNISRLIKGTESKITFKKK